MILEELEISLVELLGDNFSIDVDEDGQLVIFTGLKENEDGDLIPSEEDEDDLEDSEFDPLEEDIDED